MTGTNAARANLLFRTGVDQFNRSDYFEAHETWEGLWRDCRGPEREFLQGLIQAAAAMHHLRRGNRAGAAAVAGRAKRHMAGYDRRYFGIDVAAFWEQIEHWIPGPDGGPPAGASGPRIVLHPPG